MVIWLSQLLYEQQLIMIMLLQLWIYDESNNIKNEFIISSAYMKWIDQNSVINNRKLYEKKKNVQYQLYPFKRADNMGNSLVKYNLTNKWLVYSILCEPLVTH